MANLVPAETADSHPIREDDVSVPAGIDAAMVEAISRDHEPLRTWPDAVAQLYRDEVVQRLYREQYFLFLLGLLLGLSTVVVDILVNPQMMSEGAWLRVLAIAPLTMLGLAAGARGWTQVLAFCVGAAPIAFIAVIVHLAMHLPPDASARYFSGTILLIGLANIVLPYSLRGLIIFDVSAIAVTAAMLALQGTDTLVENADTLAVIAIAASATLPIAARFERLRQNNFILTLRARMFGRELLKANTALLSLSETDPLTGIGNRRRFEREFQSVICAPGTKGRSADRIALMMIDLDHFKSFNDAHGHQAGDSCLKLVAASLREIFDEADGIVARYGGEEFIAAVRKSSSAEALAIAEEVRQTVAAVLMPGSESVGTESRRSLVTASIGVGIAPAAAKLPQEELIEMADAALYSGKDSGRNRVEVVEAEAAFGLRP